MTWPLPGLHSHPVHRVSEIRHPDGIQDDKEAGQVTGQLVVKDGDDRHQYSFSHPILSTLMLTMILVRNNSHTGLRFKIITISSLLSPSPWQDIFWGWPACNFQTLPWKAYKLIESRQPGSFFHESVLVSFFPCPSVSFWFLQCLVFQCLCVFWVSSMSVCLFKVSSMSVCLFKVFSMPVLCMFGLFVIVKDEKANRESETWRRFNLVGRRTENLRAMLKRRGKSNLCIRTFALKVAMSK